MLPQKNIYNILPVEAVKSFGGCKKLVSSQRSALFTNDF